MTEQQHLRFLDGLRALAALVVVFHHAWLQSWPYTMYPVAKPAGALGLLTGWLAFGKVAVTAFIVISGFCLMIPVVRSNRIIRPMQFLWRRCQRILPPYYAALGLTLLLDVFVIKQHSHTIYDGSFPLSFGGIISHVLLVQNFTSNPYQISGPFWSIAVEFQIYLLFPLFVLVYKRLGVYAMLLTTSIAGCAASILLRRAGFAETYLHYIIMFGLGMAAAHWAFSLELKNRSRLVAISAGLIPLSALVGIIAHHQLGSNKLLTDTLFAVVVSCVLILATRLPGSGLPRALSLPALVWIGSFSYSVYLMHFPLQQLVWQLIAQPNHWRPAPTFLFIATIGTLIIITVSFAFFWLFERPYLRESADGRRRARLADTSLSS